MAGIGNSYYDLADLHKDKGPGDVINQLTELNPMLKDASAVMCNNGTQHQHSIVTGLPEVAWGKLYKGTPQSKSGKQQVSDSTGFVEGISTIDSRVLELAGDKRNNVRFTEAQTFLESMAQEVQEKMIYGNDSTNASEFMGLAPRFNDKSAVNGRQIIDAGGTGSDNQSIWIVTWGDRFCHTIYPDGTTAGVSREDKGEQRVLDADGNPYYAFEEKFKQHIGLAVKDWRYITRVANIDTSNLLADPSDIDGSGNDLYHFLRKATYQNQGRRVKQSNGQDGFYAGGKVCMYCTTDVLEALDALGTNSGGSDNFTRLTPMEIQGEEVQTYRGIIIRETDALLNTEAQVT